MTNEFAPWPVEDQEAGVVPPDVARRLRALADIASRDPSIAGTAYRAINPLLLAGAAEIEALEAELADWRKLSNKMHSGQYPLLPWPELNQDAAFVAWVIDQLRARTLNP